MDKDTLEVSKEELEIVEKLMKKMDTKVSVIKVGTDRPTDDEMKERCKKVEKQLRKKVAEQINRIAEQQQEIVELKIEIDNNVDLDASNIHNRLRKEIKVSKTLMEDQRMAINKLEREKRDIGSERGSLKRLNDEYEKEVKELKEKNKMLEGTIDKLKTEINIRIKADDRFHNLDL